jgi:cellobiose phosphorylase
VETDQEASAVQSAYQVFVLKGTAGPAWLQKKVAGEAVIDRLDRALFFPFSRRFNKNYGLITGAHTADWGDVDPEDSDQKAIYVDEKTRWTSDIYDQSMAFEACRELAEMWNRLNRRDKADFWKTKADTLRRNANRWLWQDDRGFFRMHVHLDSWRHDFEEDNMFAMGGNAQAIISGLADRNQAKRIIEQALVRQMSFKLSTISGTLLPPYPPGFFKHPAMDEPFEYQNGGQWDWFGGRLIYAMFENGFSAQAREKLAEVIRKDIANGGLYEWDTPDGSGRGSDFYGGSAGSLARAMYEGLFGLQLTERGICLEPKLGELTAAVHIDLPAADIFAAYEYQPIRAERKIIFRYNSNDPRPGKVQILIPLEFFGLTERDQIGRKLEVMRDGAKASFQWLQLNQDNFVIVDTDLQNHTLEITLNR